MNRVSTAKRMLVQKGPLLALSACLVFSNFFITLVIASKLGFGVGLDTYYLALAIYLFFLTLIGWSLTNVITPYLIQHGIERNFSKVFYVVCVWGGAVLLGSVLLSPLLSSLIFNNYKSDNSLYYLNSIFIIACFIFFADLLAQVFICLENASSRFVRAAAINLFSSLVGLALSFYLVDYFNAVGALITQFTIKLVLLLSLLFLNRKYLYSYAYDTYVAKIIFSKAKYFFISGLFYRTEDLTEKLIASYLAPGLLSLVSFVQRVYGAVITVFNTVVIAPTLTKFCINVAENSGDADHKMLKNVTMAIVLASCFGFPLIYFFGESLFMLIFSGKVLEVKDNVSITLIVIFPTFIFFTVSQLLHNFLLSRAKEKEIVLFDSLAYSITLSIKIFMTISYGYMGFLISIVISPFVKLMFKYYLVLGLIKHEK